MTVLARLWGRKGEGEGLALQTLRADGVPNPSPLSMPATHAPSREPQGAGPARRPKRRSRPTTLSRLYPETPPEPAGHAKILLELIREECPQFVGTYVPSSDLSRFYGELCTRHGWTRRHWTSIGRELGRLAERKVVKRSGKRFRAYRIPGRGLRNR